MAKSVRKDADEGRFTGKPGKDGEYISKKLFKDIDEKDMPVYPPHWKVKIGEGENTETIELENIREFNVAQPSILMSPLLKISDPEPVIVGIVANPITTDIEISPKLRYAREFN